MFYRFKRLFTARARDEAHRPIPYHWIGNRENLALINDASGRWIATVSHDGYGKYAVVVAVSPWRALSLLWQNDGFLVSLLGFPRLTVQLYDVKSDNIRPARRLAEEVLGVRL